MNQEWLILIFSTISLSIGVLMWQKSNRLRVNGKRALGIIVSNNFKYDGDGGYYYPVIRFLTEKKEWITKELNVGFQPEKPLGKKLRVIYNADDPNEFQLDSVFLLLVLPRLLVAGGITGIAFGLMLYLGYV